MTDIHTTHLGTNTPVHTLRRDAGEAQNAFRRAGRGRDMLGIRVEVEVVRPRRPIVERDVKPENEAHHA